jgi:hypothetical protein
MSLPTAFFHEESASVRFWVEIDGAYVGATISRQTLHYRYKPDSGNDEALATYLQNAPEIDAAVRRRVATGSREPVMLRDFDVRWESSGVSSRS